MEETSEKYKMWQTLAVVFLILAILCGILQYGNWDKLCFGAAFFSVIMAVYVMLRYGRCRVCYNLLDPYILFHGGTASFVVHLWRMRRRRNANFSEYAGNDKRRNEGFFQEGKKIGCAVHTEKNSRSCWKHFLVPKKRDSLSLYWYMKRCAHGLSFHLRRGRAYLDYPQCRRKDIRTGKGNAGLWSGLMQKIGQ